MEFFCVRPKRRHSKEKAKKTTVKTKTKHQHTKRKKKTPRDHDKAQAVPKMAYPLYGGGGGRLSLGSNPPFPDHRYFFSPAPSQSFPSPDREQRAYGCPKCPKPAPTQDFNQKVNDWNLMDTTPTNPGTDHAALDEPPIRQVSKKHATKRGSKKAPSKSAAETSTSSYHHHQSMAMKEIYVYPWSLSHISFPVVDHSTRRRDPLAPQRPTCSMAVAPECATVQDIKATLAPHGSDLVVYARLSAAGETAPIDNFANITDLREGSLQLEVWDCDAVDESAKAGMNGVGGRGLNVMEKIFGTLD
ncbi:Uu.00g076370.m01.CDS01 [Anthostomella pinea]|uniref:Uu.00g076370.m01.CDS01 n=1 Tax=Anthostomella pinea TaxID=933095 RepID=A0AAI8VVU8_9PEZI|nr:Uu.00g076370.m01.CDS01 [Anthostomella pinea]